MAAYWSDVVTVNGIEMPGIVNVSWAPAPERKVCVDCGSWSRPCDCPRFAISVTVHCYLCDAKHDPRVQAPRVCEECRRRYLP
jgi:hypothetical protein